MIILTRTAKGTEHSVGVGVCLADVNVRNPVAAVNVRKGTVHNGAAEV